VNALQEPGDAGADFDVLGAVQLTDPVGGDRLVALHDFHDRDFDRRRRGGGGLLAAAGHQQAKCAHDSAELDSLHTLPRVRRGRVYARCPRAEELPQRAGAAPGTRATFTVECA